MAVKLRLTRLGRSHRAFFRLRAADERGPTDGRFLEELGYVDPLAKDEGKQVSLKKERIEYWLSVGAKISPTVETLLGKHGIAGRKKPAVKKRAPRKAAPKKAAAARA